MIILLGLTWFSVTTLLFYMKTKLEDEEVHTVLVWRCVLWPLVFLKNGYLGAMLIIFYVLSIVVLAFGIKYYGSEHFAKIEELLERGIYL